MKKYDYLIVGSGLTGAMYAYILKKHGSVLVIDRNPYIGGLCRTEFVNGIHQHMYGAHIFRTNDIEVWNFVNGFCEFRSFVNTPIAVNKGNVYNMPFNMNTFAKLYGVVEPQEALNAIQADSVPCEAPTNLEEYVLSKVGKKVYNELIKGYTQKQWGRECKELPVSVMSHIPIRLTYNNNYFNEKYQGVPVYGYSDFIGMLLEGCDIVQSEYNKSCNHIAKNVIYTGPLDEYFDFKYGKLEYRSVKFEHKTFDIEDKQGVAVFNYTGYEVPYTRSIEHKHFLNEKSDKTIVSYEYPTTQEETKMRIYPVEDNENLELFAKYKELAARQKVMFVGQQADFKSYNMNTIVTNILTWKRELKL